MDNAASADQTDDESSELHSALGQLDLRLSERQHAQLLAFIHLLNKWNAAYNLTAVRELSEQRVRHLFDCLSIVPALAADLVPGAVVLDVGSGGGLPGAVLAICHPGVQVHTVDAVGKKAAFVTQVSGALGLANLHAHHARVEALVAGRDLPPATLITSRAFSSLADFVRLTAHLHAPTGRWAAMKGAFPADEIAALPAQVGVVQTLALSVPHLDAQRHLVMIAARR